MFKENNILTTKRLTNEELNQLIVQYQNGDENAFNDLYYKTYNIIWSISKSFFPTDIELCNDCIQDIYLNLYQKCKKYNVTKGDFLPWFKKTAENICKTYYVKQKNSNSKKFYVQFDDQEHEALEFEETKYYFNPDAFIDRAENTKLIDEIIKQLPEQHRECLLLYLSDYKQNRISELLDIPLGTVKSRIYNGKRFVEKKVRELEKQGIKLYGMPPFTFFAWAFAQEGNTKTIQEAFSNLLLVKKVAIHSKKSTLVTLFPKLQHGFIAGCTTMNFVIAIFGTIIIGTGGYYSISRSNPKLPQLPRLPMMQNFPLSDFPEELNDPAPPMDVQNDTNREDPEDIKDTENIVSDENMENMENMENATTPVPNTPTEPPADVPIDQILTMERSHYFIGTYDSFRPDFKLTPGHSMPFAPHELTWSTDADPNIMTIDHNGWIHVVSKDLQKNYTATVTAQFPNYEMHCKVTIVVEQITTNLPYSYHEILANQTFQCTASPGAQWSSDNPTIASITPDGLLETHGYQGEVTLTVAYPNIDRFTTNFRLRVMLPGIGLVDTEGTLSVGSSNSIPTNTPHYELLRTDLFFSPAFSYYSSNPEVASFDKTTVTYDDYSTLTAHMPGTTEIVIRALFPTTEKSEFRKTIVVQ